MRWFIGVALGLGLVLAGCGGGDATRNPTTTPTALVESTSAFQEFSGLTIPASARVIQLRVVVDSTGAPAYRVQFELPSDELDQFCVDGQLSKPLRVVTIPADVRERFDYEGDSSTGVAVAEASRPSDARLQRQVFAVGTTNPTAQVYVYAYRMPS